jgi:single-stranded-DNA-specific exonuclease
MQAHRQAEETFDPKNDAAIVLASAGWHAGVIGIVAGRLAEKYHRPVVLIALDELGIKPGVGSARSAAGLDLHQTLGVCSQDLLSHGGHAAAAGFKIDPSRIESFRAAFCEYASESIGAEDLVAELWIDAETPLSALTLQAVEQIERLSPFGQGNRRPILCATGVSLAAAPQRIGGDGRHMAVTLNQHGAMLRGVAFGGGDWTDELSQISAPLAVAFKPVINNFRGRKSVELHLADWRLAATGSALP